MNYFINIILGFGSFLLVNKIFPPAGLGIEEGFHDYMVEGVDLREDSTAGTSDRETKLDPESGVAVVSVHT